MPRILILAGAMALCLAAPAFADGPFEPNETPDEASVPLSGGQLTAALETPQDRDWYRIYALPHRQIGVLATLTGPCPASYGSVSADLFDADKPYGQVLANLRVGYTGYGPRISDRTAFTSEAGHRYFVRVTQSSCVGGAYTLDIAPAENLTRTLVDTTPCNDARRTASRDRARWYGLRLTARRAHGSRRALLRTRAELQRQEATTSTSAAQVACRRPALTGYPFS